MCAHAVNLTGLGYVGPRMDLLQIFAYACSIDLGPLSCIDLQHACTLSS